MLPQFHNQQYNREQVKQQVENIQGPAEISVHQQADFFNDMRFGDKRGQAEEECGSNQERVRYLFKPFHMFATGIGYRQRLFEIPTNWVTWTDVSSMDFPWVLTTGMPYFLKICSDWYSSWVQVDIFA